MLYYDQGATGMDVGYLILLIMYVPPPRSSAGKYYLQRFDMIVNANCNFFIHVANFGDPSQPSDGYLEPYTSTSLGTKVNAAHVFQNGLLATEEIVCSSNIEWETINGSSCTVNENYQVLLLAT